MNYQEYGNKDGPLMLFLHGGGVSSWMWDRQIEYFTDYHCVTVDLPEQGNNRHSEKFSISSCSYRVSELIKKIANGKQVIVVGFSIGAQVLTHMVSSTPHMIHYAMINSALVRSSRLVELLIEPLVRVTFPLIRSRCFSKLQAKELYIGDEYFEQYYEESKEMKRQTLVRILKENTTFDIPDQFSEATTRILITVGEYEKSIIKKSATDLLHVNPNSTGIIISDVGHGAPLKTPYLFNHILEDWLNNTLNAEKK